MEKKVMEQCCLGGNSGTDHRKLDISCGGQEFFQRLIAAVVDVDRAVFGIAGAVGGVISQIAIPFV